eukprot:470417_1
MMATFSFIVTCLFVHSKGQCRLSCESKHDDLQDLVEAMIDLGYSVSSGYFGLYDATTTYTYTVPFARPDTIYLVSQFDDGEIYTRFGGQDAILFRTCTPPNVKYFGYRSYSTVRIIEQSFNYTPTEYTELTASLGDTLNHMIINTESSDDTLFPAPFDRKTNIVTTGDEQTWTDIVTSFTNVGLLTVMSLNLDAVNSTLFNYSQSELEVPRDTLSLVYRIQWDEHNECDKSQYLNHSFPFYRFYKTSRNPQYPINKKLRSPYDSFIPATQNCSLWENCPANRVYFELSISTLIEYVEMQYKYTFISNTTLNNDVMNDSIYIFKHGIYCTEHQTNCMFDNRDTYYSWDGEQHTLSTTDFYLIVGLNHNNYSMSTTNSISLAVNDEDFSFEIVDIITNDCYQKYDLMDIVNCSQTESGCQQLKNVFVIQIARPNNCIDATISSMCPSYKVLGSNDRFIFFGEATLNPQTKTIPDHNQLIEWRLLKFSITASPTTSETASPTTLETASPTSISTDDQSDLFFTHWDKWVWIIVVLCVGCIVVIVCTYVLVRKRTRYESDGFMYHEMIQTVAK